MKLRKHLDLGEVQRGHFLGRWGEESLMVIKATG